MCEHVWVNLKELSKLFRNSDAQLTCKQGPIRQDYWMWWTGQTSDIVLYRMMWKWSFLVVCPQMLHRLASLQIIGTTVTEPTTKSYDETEKDNAHNKLIGIWYYEWYKKQSLTKTLRYVPTMPTSVTAHIRSSLLQKGMFTQCVKTTAVLNQQWTCSVRVSQIPCF